MHLLLKHPLVDCDVEEAAVWYHQRDPRVAVRLVDETRRAMRSAAENPFYYFVCFDDIRRVRLHRFPHSVFFKVSDNTVFVLAVLHGAREVEELIQGRSTSD